VVRIAATPESGNDGPKLADEILAAVTRITADGDGDGSLSGDDPSASHNGNGAARASGTGSGQSSEGQPPGAAPVD
jgi:hypothetical protein